MVLKGWKRGSATTEEVYGPFQVESARYQRADGYAKRMQTLRCPDWVNVVPKTCDGRAILVRQYRPGIGRFTLEFPGGVVDPGESPELCAAREVREETGFGEGEVISLGAFAANPALQNNRVHYYLIDGVRSLEAPQFDGEAEECEVVEHPFEKLSELLDLPEFCHGLCVASVALATRWRRSRQVAARPAFGSSPLNQRPRAGHSERHPPCQRLAGYFEEEAASAPP